MRIEIHYIKTREQDRCPMVNIDGDGFSYSNIFNVYQGGKSGVGIQVSDASKEKELLEMCNKIADAVYQFNPAKQ